MIVDEAEMRLEVPEDPFLQCGAHAELPAVASVASGASGASTASGVSVAEVKSHVSVARRLASLTTARRIRSGPDDKHGDQHPNEQQHLF